MAVLAITIEESDLQTLAGIPNYIVLTTNVPATVFFTLDGTDPTTSSEMAVGQIPLPTDNPSVILKMFATDGTTTCPIVTNVFSHNIVPNRNAHDKISGLTTSGPNGPDPFPFGINSPVQPVTYGNTGGITVDSPEIDGIPDGFDGTATGTSSNETDEPLAAYDFEYSETDSIGERGPGIGTLPAQVTVVIPPPSADYSEANSAIFDPKALVIFQDGTKPPEDPDQSLLNRPFFNLENPEFARDGIMYNTTAFEGAIPNGSFLRPHFNPRDNTYTFYYRDSLTNRWIISKEPYKPKNPDAGALYKVVMPIRKKNGIGKIFKWIPFRRRVLDA